MDYLWLFLVDLFLIASVCSRCGKAADWTYGGGHSAHGGGSQEWRDKYPTCGGSKQSPIDLKPATATLAEGVESFKWFGYSNEYIPQGHKFKLTNNGHTVQLNVNTPTIAISGGGLLSHFTLAQVHMHWGDVYSVGSEHTVNGWSYPLEIHFVHYKTDLNNITAAVAQPGGLAVLGVFAQVNAVAFRHEAFEYITGELKGVEFKDNSIEIDPIQLNSLLPTKTSEFYRYLGSLTTPPCYESVIWTVFRQPINISAMQLAKLRTLDHYDQLTNVSEPLVNNYRPVQPLNGRTVLRTFAFKSSASHDSAGHNSPAGTHGSTGHDTAAVASDAAAAAAGATATSTSPGIKKLLFSSVIPGIVIVYLTMAVQPLYRREC